MINKINLDNLTFDLDPPGNKFLRIYGISKLCNILFSKELAKKLEPLGELRYLPISYFFMLGERVIPIYSSVEWKMFLKVSIMYN